MVVWIGFDRECKGGENTEWKGGRGENGWEEMDGLRRPGEEGRSG